MLRSVFGYLVKEASKKSMAFIFSVKNIWTAWPFDTWDENTTVFLIVDKQPLTRKNILEKFGFQCLNF
jgi:hypothetical protein